MIQNLKRVNIFTFQVLRSSSPKNLGVLQGFTGAKEDDGSGMFRINGIYL